MQLLVTVGSGSFDQLIEAVNRQLLNRGWSVCCQIGQGQVLPDSEYFRFSDDYRRRMQQADVVISHGGAATVFELLEMGKKLVLVPNCFRIDQHQQDLARYVEQKHYGEVCWSLEQLEACVERCIKTDYQPYHKQAFFMAGEALSFFGVTDE